MKLGSLCSGAGGLDLAVEQVFGATTVWHAETDRAASKVLAHRWPGVPNHGDLTTTDWTAVEPVDIIAAGWPCTPWSLAGKRKGAEDERAIWPHIAGAVRLLRPRFVVLENVGAVLAVGEFQRTASDLAEIGYDLRWTCLRASDIGAPHRRERLFIVAADAGGAGLGGGAQLDSQQTQQETDHPHRGHSDRRDVETAVADAGWGKYEPAIRRWERILGRPTPSPTEPNRNGKPRLNPAFSEFMMGWPPGWVTDPAIGISRNDQLRCIGNGVVPQQAIAALRWLINLEAVA